MGEKNKTESKEVIIGPREVSPEHTRTHAHTGGRGGRERQRQRDTERCKEVDGKQQLKVEKEKITASTLMG